MRSVLPALVGAAVLTIGATGCAGSSDDDPTASADTTASPSTPTAPSPTAQAARAVPAPGDLLQFACREGADGKTWSAEGVIVNSAAKADYRVTVLVAPPGVTKATARRLVIPKVETGVETPFTVEKLPANPGSQADCRVQLVRLG